MILNRPKTTDEPVFTECSHDFFNYLYINGIMTPIFSARRREIISGVAVENLWGRRSAHSGWVVPRLEETE